MDRWSKFTNAEIYILKRMGMESSFNFFCEGGYNEEQKRLHNDLLNELGKADANRLYGRTQQMKD